MSSVDSGMYPLPLWNNQSTKNLFILLGVFLVALWALARVLIPSLKRTMKKYGWFMRETAAMKMIRIDSFADMIAPTNTAPKDKQY